MNRWTSLWSEGIFFYRANTVILIHESQITVLPWQLPTKNHRRLGQVLRVSHTDLEIATWFDWEEKPGVLLDGQKVWERRD